MSLIYTGIGSRQTPESILEQMTKFARRLSFYGYTLRSGGAEGADTAFEVGAVRSEIYLPWKGFNKNDSDLYEVSDEAIEMAMHYHPAPERLKDSHRRLHGRNAYQILGKDLNTPSEFVIFWAPEKNGKVEGGTATAVSIARERNIPTFNLYDDENALDGYFNKLYIEFIFRYCRHIALFYSEGIDEDDLTRLDVIFIKDRHSDKDLKDIKKLFKKYYGLHKKDKYNPTEIERFK